MKRVAFTVAVLGVLAVVAASDLQAAGAPGGPGGRGGDRRGGQFPNPLLRLFDADGDGVLSEAEVANAGAKLKELDTSKDGKISSEELRGAMGFGPGAGGRGMPGGPGGMGRGGSGGAAAGSGEFSSAPLPKDDAEKKILDALEAMRRGPRYANVSPTDGRLLRMLAESVGAKTVVEIGTSTGESGVWFALALRTTGGKLYTHEIDAGRAKIAQKNFQKAGVADIITIIQGDAHETVKQHKGPIDVLFLDADKEGYIDYLEKLLPIVRPGGLIIAHNMNPRQADPRYVKYITETPGLDTSFLLMEGAGVGVTMKKR
ncbi:MAG: class I SAM-dependent methyltransferase [Planctomycetes bacterium]|nr:class I SAM-dependent methyltransferase [Planctomycetota bacterium]